MRYDEDNFIKERLDDLELRIKMLNIQIKKLLRD